MSNCVHCGQAFHPLELPRPGNEGDHDRAHTPRGPMHFECYWKVKERAAKLALTPMKGTK